ncbi:hypothetical protein DPV78_005802, partial [Talaromyces pinophilus]
TAGYLFLNAPEYHNGVVGSPECVLLEVSIWWYQSLNSASPTAILLEDTISHVRKRIRLYFPTMRLDFNYRVLSIVCAIDLMAACFVYMLTANIVNILMATHSGSMVAQINALPPSLLGQSPLYDTLYTCTNLYVSTPTVKTGVQVNGFRIEPILLTQRNKQQPLRRFQIGQLRLIQTAHTVPQQIGIGVGVSLGAIILVGLLAIWLLMRRKRNRQTIPPSETILETTNTKPELDSAPAPVKELDSANNIFVDIPTCC